MPSDGKWSIEPKSSASYRTRIIVRRPKDAARFNGTVVVEWMNESAGESAPDWDYLNPMLMRDGYAYVAVSAQALGVEGGKPILGSPVAGSSSGLVGTDPARYGSLHHPGDQYALDMFAQIGKALHNPKGSVLGGLHPQHVLAVGESQSAFYLTTFADAPQPVTHAFDGIFIHSRGGSGAPLSGTSITNKVSGDLRIRTDLDVPVFMFETQTDLIASGTCQPSSPIPTGSGPGRWRARRMRTPSSSARPPVCSAAPTPVNDGPQHTAVQAAFTAFDKWVARGTPPPFPPPFRLASTDPAKLALDDHGNVIGGVRTPAVDVPVSTLSGAAPPGSSEICGLFGSSMSFSPAALANLYRTKTNYLSLYKASLDKAIAGGYILSADRAGLLAQADQVQLPS